MDFALIDCNSTINSNWYNPVIVYENSSNRTENPCVGSSILPLDTSNINDLEDCISDKIKQQSLSPGPHMGNFIFPVLNST